MARKPIREVLERRKEGREEGREEEGREERRKEGRKLGRKRNDPGGDLGTCINLPTFCSPGILSGIIPDPNLGRLAGPTTSATTEADSY